LGFWQFGAVLAGLLVITFPQVVAGFEIFGYLDFGQFAFPIAFYHRESFWRGEWPFWNALNNCGVPFLAQWNTLTLYPPSLFYLLLPFPWSLGVFLLLHLFWGGLGMHFLAGRMTNSRMAGTVAGAVFAFNGFAWYALIWPHVITAMAWAPWVLLTVECALTGNARAVLLAGLVGAMQLFTGGAEVIVLTWLAALVLCLPHALGGVIPRLKLLARLSLVVGLALALAAIQLLPFFDLLAHSQRSRSYGDPSLATLPPTGLVNYLVPVFHCSRNPQGLFVPPNHWTGSYYLGVGVVLLALVAVWHVRDMRVRLLLGLTGFSLMMALGRNGLLYDWLTVLVPALGFMRFPIKFVILATITIPLLAAFGLAWLGSLPDQGSIQGGKRLIVVSAGIALAIGVVVWAAAAHPVAVGESKFVRMNALVRLIFLLLITGCLLALCGWREVKPGRWLQIALIALLWFDVRTHNADLSPTVRPGAFEPDAARRYLHWADEMKAGVSRVMESQSALRTMLAIGFRNLDDDTAGRRLSQFFDFNLLDHVPKVDGFYSLDLKEYSRIFNRLYYGTNAEPNGLLDFLGVSRVSSRTNATEWIARDSFLPLVTGGQQPVFADDQTTLDAVLSKEFEPRRVVYLPSSVRGEVRATGPAQVNIRRTEFSARRLDIQLEADASGLLVVAQSFYHPWHAWLDGKRVPVWRANYAFQALEVPAGTHHVSLVYQDRAFVCGAIISAVALLICPVAWFRFGGSRRSPA
jgi:hypothetical protein